MKTGLKIVDGVYVNLANVCVAIFEEKSIQLQFSDENLINVNVPDPKHPYSSGYKIEINELKRIERQVKEYLEVDKVKETAEA